MFFYGGRSKADACVFTKKWYCKFRGVQVLAAKQLVILRILLKHHPEELFGSQIIKESNGEISGGVAYVYLSRMEEMGQVTSRTEDLSSGEVRFPQRLYRLTDVGYNRTQEAESEEDFLGNVVPNC